jgi:hypothetical protein
MSVMPGVRQRHPFANYVPLAEVAERRVPVKHLCLHRFQLRATRCAKPSIKILLGIVGRAFVKKVRPLPSHAIAARASEISTFLGVAVWARLIARSRASPLGGGYVEDCCRWLDRIVGIQLHSSRRLLFPEQARRALASAMHASPNPNIRSMFYQQGRHSRTSPLSLPARISITRCARKLAKYANCRSRAGITNLFASSKGGDQTVTPDPFASPPPLVAAPLATKGPPGGESSGRCACNTTPRGDCRLPSRVTRQRRSASSLRLLANPTCQFRVLF